MTDHPPVAGGQARSSGLVAGLALDDEVVRVAVAEPAGTGGLQLVDVAEADLRPGVVRDGRVVDGAALGARIGELWRALELVGVPTYLGFHPLDAVVAVVEVAGPDLGGHNPPSVGVRNGWPSEVVDAIDAVRARYGLEPVWAATSLELAGRQVVQLAACRREDMTNAVWAARRSGVWVAGVELSALALVRALRPDGRPTGVLVDGSASPKGALAVVVLEGVALAAGRLADRNLPGNPAGEGGASGAMWPLPVEPVAASLGLPAGAIGQAPAILRSSALEAEPTPIAGLLRAPGEGLAASSPEMGPAAAVAVGLALAAVGDEAAVASRDLRASMIAASAGVLASARPAGRGGTTQAEARGDDAAPAGFTVTGAGAGAAEYAGGQAAAPAPLEPMTNSAGEAAVPEGLVGAGGGAVAAVGVAGMSAREVNARGAGPSVMRDSQGRKVRRAAAVAAVAGATALGGYLAFRTGGEDRPEGLAPKPTAAPTSANAVGGATTSVASAGGAGQTGGSVVPTSAGTPAALTATTPTATTPTATTATARTGSTPSSVPATPSTVPAGSVATPPSSGPPTTAVPAEALVPHSGTYAGGKLYLAGAVADQATADRLKAKAAGVVGPENVVGDYFVHPAAPRDTDGRVNIGDAVLFASGSAAVAPGYAPALELLARALTLNPDAKLLIEGHTDIAGALTTNLELSQARAETIKAALIARGIDHSRLVAVGKGPFVPRADNATEEGRQLNRRIELTFVGLLS